MKKLAIMAAGLMLGSVLASGAMAEDVTLTWQMWAGGDADVAGWQELGNRSVNVGEHHGVGVTDLVQAGDCEQAAAVLLLATPALFE